MSKCHRMFAGIILLIAIVLGLLVNILPADRLEFVVPISRFFDVMLPILAVGALIKYITCYPKQHNDEKCCDKAEK